MTRAFLVGAAAAALATAWSTAAAAQERRASTIEEVVVTATKREQTLQEVPISLSVVSGDRIRQDGIVQFNDLQASIPNLQIDQTNGNFAITMRGLGAGPGNLSFEQSVGLFVDGVYLSRARSFQTPMLDAARVEVVRGPQGALFGKNTNAGAISIVTRKPTRTFEAEARASAELQRGGWNGEGFISGPLTDKLSGRLTARSGYTAPYIDNPFKGGDEYSTRHQAVRAQLEWTPAGGFDALLKVEGSSLRQSGGNTMFNYIGDASCALCTAARTQGGGATAQEYPGFRRTTRNASPEYDNTKSALGVLTLNLTAGDWKLTSISALQGLTSDQNVDVDGSALTFLESGISEDSTSLFQELRATREFDNGAVLIAGATYIDTELKIIQSSIYRAASVPVSTPLNGRTTRRFNQDGRSLSPFVSLEAPVSEAITLSASLRYSKESKTGRARHDVVGVLPATFRPYDLQATRKEGLWDYSARIRYAFNPDASVYLSYATGTKGGGFVSNDSLLLTNILAGIATYQYEDEEAKSLEAGGKFRLLEGRGTLNIAVFRTKFANLQVSQFNGTAFVTGNAAKATTQGVEADTAWKLGSIFEVGGNIGYLKARYDDYPGGQCLYNAPAGCLPRNNNLAGATLVRAPKWKGEAFVSADAPVASSWILSGRVSLDYTSRSYFQPDLAPLNSQPAFSKFNARVGLRPDNGAWEVALVGRNLTNEATISQAFNNPNFGGNSHVVVVGQPRLVSLEVSARF